ncbi:MAG: Rpn family recombination-promoting nuclease/putative transposase [Peptococcaceae bacterium]|nr:Rpn family recombination-promoting nuclease/putative transposase [Peptococcaceae bacterium]MBP3341241.1 Rpn family recombination-promoting nuclease/putative transposase [Peptococcaceae bacterium]
MSANREYKDSVFSLYLSDPQRLIDVYNAVAKTDYPPDTPVEINTLTDVLYKNQINDLSFVLDGQVVVLIEHQSTINENMALRLFLYSARVYEKITKQKPLYKRKRVKIPVPQFIVLYNGNEPFPEYMEQKLSDNYIVEQENPQLELKVNIYNINYEMNAEIVQRSKSLSQYSRFIGKIKENLADGLTLEESIQQAIEYGITHDIMREFLETNGTEVANMLLSGWNMDEALTVSKEEGYEDGFEDGFAGGEKCERENNIYKLSSKLSPEEIAETLQLPLDYVLDVLEKE